MQIYLNKSCGFYPEPWRFFVAVFVAVWSSVQPSTQVGFETEDGLVFGDAEGRFHLSLRAACFSSQRLLPGKGYYGWASLGVTG